MTNLLYSVFLTSFFTTSDNLLKSTGTGSSLSISNLSTSVFKLAKFDFSAKLLTSTCHTFLKLVFVASLDKSTLTLMSPPKGSEGVGRYWLIYTESFLSIQPLNELSYPFHLTYNLSPFFLITFSILNSC